MTNRLRSLNNLKRKLTATEAEAVSLDWMLKKVGEAMKEEREERDKELEEYYQWYTEHFDHAEHETDI